MRPRKYLRILFAIGTTRSDRTIIATTKTTMATDATPNLGISVAIAEEAPIPNAKPSTRQVKFARPSRAEGLRVKYATQPMNMAHTGSDKVALAKAAAAAVTAAASVKPMNWPRI